MCSFYNQLLTRLKKDGTIDVGLGYLKLDHSNNIKYFSLINYGLIIPQKLICLVKQQHIKSGPQSINGKWYEHKFSRPFKNVPFTLKVLRIIGQL